MTGNKRNIRLSKCSIGNEEREAVMRVFDNEYFGMGKEVQAFEQELKTYLDTPNEVVCVNTGTAALHLALLCLDIGEGDEVLVPSLTYVASYQAISATGAIPVSCDVLEDSVFLDLEDAKKRITKKTKAIMPVHYASNSKQIASVYAFAKEFSLRVIEDAAHSIGSMRNGEKVGKTGDIICFSFDGIKNITSGEGGAIITSDLELAQRIKDARLLGVEKDTEKRYQGQRSWVFDVKYQGFRYHMSDIMAAIGRAQLSKIDKLASRRKEIAQRYVQGLKDNKSLRLLDFDFSAIAPHIFAVNVMDNKRDSFLKELNERGIACGMHYYPNHFLTKYKTNYSLPVTEKLSNSLMTLPMHPDLTNDDIDYVVAELNAIS